MLVDMFVQFLAVPLNKWGPEFILSRAMPALLSLLNLAVMQSVPFLSGTTGTKRCRGRMTNILSPQELFHNLLSKESEGPITCSPSCKRSMSINARSPHAWVFYYMKRLSSWWQAMPASLPLMDVKASNRGFRQIVYACVVNFWVSASACKSLSWRTGPGKRAVSEHVVVKEVHVCSYLPFYY